MLDNSVRESFHYRKAQTLPLVCNMVRFIGHVLWEYSNTKVYATIIDIKEELWLQMRPFANEIN
jgi:hypothetical protein